MSKPGTRIELPPEAEPAREFFEALVARHEALVALYEKRIAELEKQVAALSARNVKPTPRNSSVPPSSGRAAGDLSEKSEPSDSQPSGTAVRAARAG